jgi:DNA/RNA endonuclease G (NUC1)
MSTQFQSLEIKDPERIILTGCSKLKCCMCIIFSLFIGLSIGFIFLGLYLNSTSTIIVPDDTQINYDYDYVLTNPPTGKPPTGKPTNKPPILCNVVTSSNLKSYPNTINRTYYIDFNKTIMQANYVVYIQPSVSNRCPSCRYFRVDPYKIDTLKNNDYTNSGYDRGHLVPNADYGADTFIITNVVPMLSAFNRGSWKKSEKNIRDMYKRKLIYKGCDYSNKYVSTNKNNKLYIPDGCFYVVFDSSNVRQTSGLKLLDYGYYENIGGSQCIKKLPKWINCNL